MNSGQVYAKTPIGDEAVRQSTRVVQRNLRMVLVQVDGKMTVGELAEKIGNVRLVENAINELARDGYIVPLAQADAAWALGKPKTRKEQVSAISQFSTLGRPSSLADVRPNDQASRFSSFGKPVLPVAQSSAVSSEHPHLAGPGISDRPDPRGGWRRLLYWSAFLLPLLLALLVAFFPYNNYRSDIERTLTSILEMPVNVGEVSLKILPVPHFALRDVRVGQSPQAGIALVEVYRPWSVVYSGVSGVKEITLVDAHLPVRSLLAFPAIGKAGVLRLPALAQVNMRDLRIDAGQSLVFGPFQGALQMSSGQLQGGSLETLDRTMLIMPRPQPQGVELLLEGRAWRLPGVPVNFPSFQAKARLLEDSLQISEVDASFLGGWLKGDWNLMWGTTLSMSGSGEMTRLDVRRIASDLALKMAGEGELSGFVRIAGRGSDWAGLWQAASADLQLEIRRGLLRGIDIGEATRRGAGAVVRSGSTGFDSFQAVVAVDARGVSIRDIRLDAGLLSASGQLRVVAGGEVAGGLIGQARTSVSTTRVPLTISGRLPDLTLTAAR